MSSNQSGLILWLIRFGSFYFRVILVLGQLGLTLRLIRSSQSSLTPKFIEFSHFGLIFGVILGIDHFEFRLF